MYINPININEFIKSMQAEFGLCEFKATSPTGIEIKSKGWIDYSYKLEITPQIPYSFPLKQKVKKK